jgi:pilus assembly protein CpaB
LERALMPTPKMIPALLLSLVLSGACTFVLARTLEGRRAPATVADLHYVSCARDLRSGEVLRPDSVETVPWPGNHPLSGAALKPADVLGRALLFPLAKGEPILDRDLAAPGAGIGLATKIPEGMRAIALRSDEVVGVAGFLVPGSHVDVLVTYHSAQSPEPITTTVLEDAQLLAVGQKSQPDPEGKPNSVTVVTLLLTPEQAERAVLASTQGTVHFLLRNGADRGHTDPQPLLLSMLSGASLPAVAASPARPMPMAAPSAAALLPRKAAPAPAGIETVLGGDAGSQKP